MDFRRVHQWYSPLCKISAITVTTRRKCLVCSSTGSLRNQRPRLPPDIASGDGRAGALEPTLLRHPDALSRKNDEGKTVRAMRRGRGEPGGALARRPGEERLPRPPQALGQESEVGRDIYYSW